MIDTDKYEKHSTGWKRKINHSTCSIINDDGQKVASVPYYEECNKDSQLIADAPLLLDFILWVKNTHPHYYHKLTEAYEGAKNNH